MKKMVNISFLIMSVCLAESTLVFFGMQNGLCPSFDGLTLSSLFQRAAFDLLAGLVVAIPALLLIRRNPKQSFMLNANRELVVSIAIYGLISLVLAAKLGAGIAQLYKPVYLFFFVALPEELLFGGLLFPRMKAALDASRMEFPVAMAGLLSGAIWGLCHSVSKILIGAPPIIAIASSIAGYAIAGCILCFLTEKRGDLNLAATAHAVLDPL